MLGFDNLRVESPYSIKIIQDVKYEHKMNDHATVHIKGIVEETTKMNGTINADYGDEVHLYYLDGENKKTIFKGMVAEVQTRKVNEVYYIDIEGIAATFQLDMKKKSRFFQDKDMEYPDLLNAIKGGRQSGCSIINTVGDGVKLDKPILQYRETDWELIKRVASTLNSVVFCDVLENRPRIVFGLPDWESHTITEAMPYSIHKDLAAYRIAGGSEAGLSPSDFIYYEIESGERYSIGAEVWFRKRQLYVSEIKGRMDRGLFVFKYRLSRRKGIRSNEIYNTDIVGLSLEGKVLDTQGEKVKLHLTIDDEQDKEKAYWFPYAPATGNMMYCMPQVGSSVHLHFIDKKPENAIVTGCIRKNGSSCAKTSDPSIRYWGNEHGSELKMTPSGISITGASKEPLSISIEDGVGITLTSHKKLTLNAKGDILFTTPKKIKLTATSQILIKKTGVDSGFSMENEFHFLGKNVILEGTDRTTFPKYDDEPKKGDPSKIARLSARVNTPVSKEKKGFDWGALALCAVAAVAVVAPEVAVGALVIGATLAGAATGAVAVATDGKIGSLEEKFKNGIKSIEGVVCGAALGTFGNLEKDLGSIEGLVKSLMSKKDSNYALNSLEISSADMLSKDDAYKLLYSKCLGLNFTKAYTRNDISKLPKLITFKDGNYTYTYMLSEDEQYFDGIKINTDMTLKDGTVIGGGFYSYKLVNSDEPKMDEDIIFAGGEDVEGADKAEVEMEEEGEEASLSNIIRDINDLNNTSNLRPSALEHIFEGEINNSGKAVGLHYDGFPTTKGSIIPGTESTPNSFGVLEAKVEVNGVAKVSNGGK